MDNNLKISNSSYVQAEEKIKGLEEDGKLRNNNVDKKLSVHRRDFLKLFSLGAAAGATACVRRPVEKVVPYVNQPIDMVPGVATYYATTCGGCASACGMHVKTREGRPVKVEGNSDHPLNRGGMCALGQAEIQGLYHPERLSSPMQLEGGAWQAKDWQETLKEIAKSVKGTNKVGIFTRGSTGNRKGFFKAFLEQLGASADNLFTWESNSLYAATARAHELAFGKSNIPRYDMAKADLIVGVGSDFQVSGLSPMSHSKGFSFGRKIRDGKRNHFIQFESHTTLTGAKADDRHVIPSGYETTVCLLLAKALLESKHSKGSASERKEIKKIIDKQGDVLNNAYEELEIGRDTFDKIATDLISKKSMVISGCGSNFDENATKLQLATLMCNTLCGAYGETVFFDERWEKSPVNPGDLQRFKDSVSSLDILFIIDSDPAFTIPNSWGIIDDLKKIKKVISIQPFPVETEKYAQYALPSHHNLESWGDENSQAGLWSFRQPSVRPTTGSWQGEDILLWIASYAGKPLPYPNYESYLKKKWRAIHKVTESPLKYETFYNLALKRGFILKQEKRSKSIMSKSISSHFKDRLKVTNSLKLVTVLDHRLVDGRGAHLPVLQEIGDALTSVAWDTWLAINPYTMKKLGIKRNQLVEVRTSFGAVKVAAYPLPGLHPNTLVIPRGNGHKDDRSTISNNNGVNPLEALKYSADKLSNEPVTSGQLVSLKPLQELYRLAAMQKTDDDLQGRDDIIKTVSLSSLSKTSHKNRLKKSLDDVPDLFPKLDKDSKHRWGMSVDLDKCNGCGACMAACSIENNIPQAGREQVLMGREMHWLRLDRYFRGDINNPEVSVQPVMCQHCNHAPCEAVCPVYATTHDPEGINSMTYNRCVGTRYCANACPYKVRRFNWWTYKWNEMGERPQDRNPRASNPDVTVRTKGVMEKCTFCLQRIRDAKHKAKEQGCDLKDGDVKTACQQTCSMDAIVFGDLKDTNSIVSKKRRDDRSYLMLGGDPNHGHYGLKTVPNVNYLAKVSLKDIKDPHHSEDSGHH